MSSDSAAQVATYSKRGRRGSEGEISFYICVCDGYSPWGCVVSAMIFSLNRPCRSWKVFTPVFSDSCERRDTAKADLFEAMQKVVVIGMTRLVVNIWV